MWLPDLFLPQIKSRPKHCSALRQSCRFNRHFFISPGSQPPPSNDQISSDDLESNNPKDLDTSCDVISK